MTYVVYIRTADVWLPISREFWSEAAAQEWALDLEPRWQREIRRVEG